METLEKPAFKPNVLDPNCPSRRALDLIADKWTSLVVITLADGTLRYSQLYQSVKGISHKMLTQTLRQLEQKRLVQRVVYPVVPPQVEYSLTPLGRTLIEALSPIHHWAEEHQHELGF